MDKRICFYQIKDLKQKDIFINTIVKMKSKIIFILKHNNNCILVWIKKNLQLIIIIQKIQKKIIVMAIDF
jgi:hypothetical protein